jgi:hypothetical protein
MSHSRFAIASALAWAAVACGTGDDGALTPDASAGGSGGNGGAASPPVINPLGRARCQAPAGVQPSPTTTEEAVELINALPKPLNVACFIEALARPLHINATNSVFSLQPAASDASPRVFIQLDRLWASVVIDGPGSYLLEFGYRPPASELTSIKGELKFPLYEPVPLSAPYDRVRSGPTTSCGPCHYNEQRADALGFAGAFDSIAFRPRPESQIGLESLLLENVTCRWDLTPHRCEMLSAVFDGGAVLDAAFPTGMATFF